MLVRSLKVDSDDKSSEVLLGLREPMGTSDTSPPENSVPTFQALISCPQRNCETSERNAQLKAEPTGRVKLRETFSRCRTSPRSFLDATIKHQLGDAQAERAQKRRA